MNFRLGGCACPGGPQTITKHCVIAPFAHRPRRARSRRVLPRPRLKGGEDADQIAFVNRVNDDGRIYVTQTSVAGTPND